jgi:hypothetical protein
LGEAVFVADAGFDALAGSTGAGFAVLAAVASPSSTSRRIASERILMASRSAKASMAMTISSGRRTGKIPAAFSPSGGRPNFFPDFRITIVDFFIDICNTK